MKCVWFLMWAQLRFPDLLCYQPAEQDLKQIRETTADTSTFKVLAKLLLRERQRDVA